MPRGRTRGYDYEDPPARPADPAVRRAHLRRIVALFRPYRLRLAGVLGLIVFSSALHHLDDYVAIVHRAAGRLAPGGALVTAFDPVRTTDRWTQRLRRLDYLLWLALGPRRLAESLARRRESRSGSGVNVGELAERHALEGIDDEAIVAALGRDGLEIAEHERYPCQRYRISDWALRAGGRATTFHLIALRPGPEVAP